MSAGEVSLALRRKQAETAFAETRAAKNLDEILKDPPERSPSPKNSTAQTLEEEAEAERLRLAEGKGRGIGGSGWTTVKKEDLAADSEEVDSNKVDEQKTKKTVEPGAEESSSQKEEDADGDDEGAWF